MMDEDPNQWVKPGDYTPPPDQLMATIRIYHDSIVLHRSEDGKTWTRTISADDLTRVFTAEASFPSGLLPDNTLWTTHTPTGLFTALWRPPRTWKVALQTAPFKPPDRLTIPMPGMVFICSPGRPPWVFAAKERPTSEDDVLYHSPTFNTFRNGRVCPGSHHFPPDPAQVPESFFDSHFSMTGDTHGRSAKHPTALMDLWKELNGQEEYPLEDLVPHTNIHEVMDLKQDLRFT